MTFLFGRETTEGVDLGRSRPRRTFWAAFGLVYMLPLIKVVAEYPGAKQVLGALALVAFVALYLATPLSMESWINPVGRRTYALLAVFAVLCAGLPFAFGAEWIGMPIYLSIVCAMTLPMCRVLWGVGLSGPPRWRRAR
ncbi:hypothetical protein [Actinomadura sp. J1-007]|uniref:hypothetical protein n=1 Tax=Actinomadura sp. J1-007 TaxID=2661913 RepID=UPI001371181A|nr:hypothetical protein [Actinomadura sp. J1-007]